MLLAGSCAYSQGNLLNSNDTICITIDHYKIVLKYAYRGRACDSLIITYDKEIETLEEIIESKNNQINLLQRAVAAQSIEIDKLRNQQQGLLVTSGILGLTVVFFALFK